MAAHQLQHPGLGLGGGGSTNRHQAEAGHGEIAIGGDRNAFVDRLAAPDDHAHLVPRLQLVVGCQGTDGRGAAHEEVGSEAWWGDRACGPVGEQVDLGGRLGSLGLGSLANLGFAGFGLIDLSQRCGLQLGHGVGCLSGLRDPVFGWCHFSYSCCWQSPASHAVLARAGKVQRGQIVGFGRRQGDTDAADGQ